MYSHSTAAKTEQNTKDEELGGNTYSTEIWIQRHFFNLSLFRRDGFKRYHVCIFFTVILCVNHPVQQSQATFSPSLHVADLENKSFHRFSASRLEIPFEYILKGNANVSRIEMISTIFQPKKTFSNSSFDPLPLDRLVPTSKPPSLNAKTRVQKSVSGLLWTQTIRYWNNQRTFHRLFWVVIRHHNWSHT